MCREVDKDKKFLGGMFNEIRCSTYGDVCFRFFFKEGFDVQLWGVLLIDGIYLFVFLEFGLVVESYYV